jgi:hypothetical protein
MSFPTCSSRTLFGSRGGQFRCGLRCGRLGRLARLATEAATKAHGREILDSAAALNVYLYAATVDHLAVGALICLLHVLGGFKLEEGVAFGFVSVAVSDKADGFKRAKVLKLLAEGGFSGGIAKAGDEESLVWVFGGFVIIPGRPMLKADLTLLLGALGAEALEEGAPLTWGEVGRVGQLLLVSGSEVVHKVGNTGEAARAGTSWGRKGLQRLTGLEEGEKSVREAALVGGTSATGWRATPAATGRLLRLARVLAVPRRHRLSRTSPTSSAQPASLPLAGDCPEP